MFCCLCLAVDECECGEECFLPCCVNSDRHWRLAQLEFVCEKCFCFASHLKCTPFESFSYFNL